MWPAELLKMTNTSSLSLTCESNRILTPLTKISAPYSEQVYSSTNELTEVIVTITPSL